MSEFRIPRKPRTEEGEAPAGGGSRGPLQGSRSGSSGSGGAGGSRPPPAPFSTPESPRGAANGKAFQPLGICPVQTNNYKVTISKRVTKFTRLNIETFLCGGKTEIQLSSGVVSMSGGINTTERGLALKTIFHKVFQRHPDVFGSDFLKYVYDAATTIYAVDDAFKGGSAILEAELKREDFTDEEWNTISRILRRPKSWFKIVLSANGVVWAGGPNAMSAENKQELCRVVETASSEGLHTLDFLHYNSQTFNIRVKPVQTPDQASEIRSGFDKAIRLVEGTGGVTDVVMAIDTKLSPFYAATSAIKFMCGKYAEAKGYSGGGGGQQRGGRPGGYGRDREGGYGGHRGYVGQRDRYQGRQDQRRRSRSRSPHRDAHQDDFNPQEAREIMDVFDRGNERQLFAKIESAMKGLFMEPIHLPKDKNRNVVVMKLSRSNAENTIFKMNMGNDEEKEISVAEYFLKKYNKRLQFPRLPLVITGRLRNEIFLPIEMLRIVPGQRIKNSKMSPSIQGAMTGRGAPLPKAHVEKIQQILITYLKIDANPHLRAFGIQVSKEPIQMQATLLAPCQRVFGGSSKPAPMRGSAGFDMRGTFFKSARVGNIAVIGFDGVRCDLNRFCSQLYAECKRSGLEVSTNPDTWIKMQLSSHNTEKLREEMKKLWKARISILVGITPEKKPEVHDVLKYYEAGIGLQTIQLHERTANCFANDIQPQTKRNVMLKFNLKCGGLNFAVEAVQRYENTPICSNVDFMNKKLLLGGVQFVGFEMTHGASRTLFDQSQGTFDGEPTVVGCGYSLKRPTELGGMNWLQPRNEYKLKDLETRFASCLKQYQRATGSFPETVVIYRTGAGDGDYPRVQEEIEEMRNASKKTAGPGKAPKLVVIVVQKTSHTRLFPKNIQGDSAQSQNVKSGTVVDSLITAPGRQEFFLVSQMAQIGTARPIKFSIVANDCGWSKNEIMNLSYHLAFAHQVSANPPAQPHVLYAADNLAKRGRNNFLQHKKLGHLNESVRRVLDSRRDLAEENKQEELDAALVDDITNAMNAMAMKNKNFWA